MMNGPTRLSHRAAWSQRYTNHPTRQDSAQPPVSSSLLSIKESMPVVRVTWFEGKDSKTKQVVAAEITDSIVRNTGTEAKYIYVVFEDVAPSNWAGGGTLYGAEIDGG
jgi:4-oxalocrotonate tautomerase